MEFANWFTIEASLKLALMCWGVRNLNNKHRQESMFLFLLFKLLIQFPFVSFLSIAILSLLSFSILSLLPLHHLFFLFKSIIYPPKIKTSSFITFCFTNGKYFCILFHSMTYFMNNVYSISFDARAPTCHTQST